MLGALLIVGLTSCRLQDSLIPDLDRLAQAKDTAGLAQYLAQGPNGANPFEPIKSGGGYGVGRFGWHALPLKDPAGTASFVVFTTPMTSEDVGELLFKVEGGKLTYLPEDDLMGVKISHHKFDIGFFTPKHFVRLRDQVTLSNETDGLKFLRFGPPYQVDLINGKKGFAQAGGMVALHLPAGKQTLDIRYHATVNLPQYAAGISKNEFTLTNDYWWPMVGRWPASYEMTLRAPRGWAVAGQGTLVSKKKAGNLVAWTYNMALPVSYYSVTAAPFVPVVQRIHGRPFTVWSSVVPRRRQRLQGPIYSGIIEFYNSTFGKWPFPGYGAVVSTSYGGGALEAYSYATYGGNDIPGEDAHEPSHTFWGGVIPNTYLHSFWNESFADFSVGLYHRNVPIGRADDRRLAFVSHPAAQPGYANFAVSKASAFVGPEASALGYGKGADVLAMLEDEIGTKTIEKAMQYWVKNHPAGTPGEWEEFEQSVNRVTGQDYGWFFQQWLDRPGYAKFGISNARFEGGAVKADLAFEGEPYRMTMEVLIGYGDGPTDLRRIVIPANETTSISIPTARQPKWVSCDPYRRLLRPLSPAESPLTINVLRQKINMGGTTDTEQRSPLASTKELIDLATEAGFQVHGFKVSYRGQTVDLRHGMAEAVVETGGKHVLLILGKSDIEPNSGDADHALFDTYGRFLCGKTPAKTEGPLTFRF